MTCYNRSTKLITRSEFNSSLQFPSDRNEELEESLREAQQACLEYEAKNKAQHGLILDLMETIRFLKAPPCDDNETNGGDEKDSKIIERMRHLLAKTAQRVSDLSEEVEQMRSRIKKQAQISRISGKNCDDHSDESEHDNEDDAEFVDVSLRDNEDDYMPCLSSSSSLSSSNASISGQPTIRLEEEIVRVSSKCTSLERSLTTLKRKSAERELRSMKSLRNMRQQIESLEQERRRRLDLQTNAEERAQALETQLLELKQENSRRNIFRREQPQHDLPGSSESRNMREIEQIELDLLAKKGIDSCREMIIMRNQLDKESHPPILLAVSEESEDSKESQCSEDDFCPGANGAITTE